MSMDTPQPKYQQSLISKSDQLFQSVLSEATLENNPIDIPAPKVSSSAAMFTMMAGALGTGIFNLPMRIYQVGVINFIIYVGLCCTFSYCGCKMLSAMILQKNIKSYSDMSFMAYGNKLKVLAEVCLVLFPWGIVVSFQVIIAKFVVQLLADVWDCDFYQDRSLDMYNQKGQIARIVVNISVILLDFGLIQLKNMRIIQKISVIGVISVTFNAAVILILVFTGFTHYGPPDIHYDGITKWDWSLFEWFKFPSGWFSLHTQTIASILFCYINHQLVFPTCKNMQEPTTSRLRRCFLVSNISEMSIYITIGLFGYFLLMQHQDILPIGSMVLTTINNSPMILGKALMVVTLFIAIPLGIHPARNILQESLQIPKTNLNHYILTIGLSASSCLIAIFFVKVNTYFGILGGTCGVLMGGGIPALCYYKLIMSNNPRQKNIKNYSILAMNAFVNVFAFIGAMLSVFSKD